MTPRQWQSILSQVDVNERKQYKRLSLVVIAFEVIVVLLAYFLVSQLRSFVASVVLMVVLTAANYILMRYIKSKSWKDPTLFRQVIARWSGLVVLAVVGSVLFMQPEVLSPSNQSELMLIKYAFSSLCFVLVPVLWFYSYREVNNMLLSKKIKGRKTSNYF